MISVFKRINRFNEADVEQVEGKQFDFILQPKTNNKKRLKPIMAMTCKGVDRYDFSVDFRYD